MTALEIFARAGPPALTRGIFLGASMAVLFSAQAVLVLTYGMLGISGCSAFTALVLVASELAVFLLAIRRLKLLAADYLFVAFVLCVATSFAINGRPADLKEATLLFLALAAYPAFRCVSLSSLDDARSGFSSVTAVIAIIGAIVTLLAMIDQWPVPRGKPIILGFDAATNFLSALGFVILIVATKPLKPQKRVAFFALLLIPVAIFAAAMIRFAFIAIVLALLLEAALSTGRQRFYVAVIIAGVFTSMATGLLVRYDSTKVLMDYAAEETRYKDANPSEGSVAPSCKLDVNERNSVAIRKALYQDAFYIIPKSGPFGIGLDGFMGISCIDGHEVHNSILQAIIEFGWLGGLSLTLLIGAAAIGLLQSARKDAGVRFVLCSLAYVTMMSMAHGHLSHDLWLFGLIGLAVGIADRPKLAAG
jgi:hypothetical protein